MSFDLPSLPEGWQYQELGNCVKPNSITYGVVQPGAPVEDGVPMIRVNNFRDSYIDTADIIKIKPEIESKYNRTRLAGGEVLLTLVGSVGQVAVVSNQFAGFNVARAIGVIHPLPEISSSWIAICLRSPLSQHMLTSRANTTVQTTINLKDVRALRIPIPPENERNQISNFLLALNDRITLLRETNATLEAIAQAIFKSWFVDFDPVRAKMEGRAPEGMDEATAALFPDSFEESELGLVPRGWQVGTLSDLATYMNGYAFKTKDWQETGHPVVKIGNVKPGMINISGASFVSASTVAVLERFQLKRGDLLVGMTGYVGETGLVPQIDPPAYLNQRVGRISTKRGIADLGFVYCLVRNPAYKGYAESKSHGSAQANVSGVDLMAYACIIPRQELLSTFSAVLCPIIERIILQYDKAQTLANLRDTLLPRLISGKLRLSEAENTIAEAIA